MKPSTIAVSVALVGVALLANLAWTSAAGDRSAAVPPAGTRYTVVATDGSHLVVTDNQANKVYFYAIGEGEKVGDPLTLRGSIDLTAVGKPTLAPTMTNRK
ncbi:MAG: hypothetical protein U0736_01445 [Gemmataceae bacterium]